MVKFVLYIEDSLRQNHMES